MNAVLLVQKQLHQTSTSSIYSLQTFTATFAQCFGTNSPPLSANDIQVLLTYMSRDKPKLSYTPETSTIKFASPDTEAQPEISENDISIASIKTLLQSLELAIPPLEKRIAELDAKAREAVTKKQTSTAKAMLRSKKLVENTLETRRSNLLQMEETLSKIEAASDNVEIIQAMKSSTSVLKSLNDAVGGVEGVERITEALRTEMDIGEDIGRVIAEPGAEAVDEGEVDEEFEALFREEREKEEAVIRAERQRKEALEKVEREKKEAEEAEATKRKLEELERFEREAEAKKAEEKKLAGEQDGAKENSRSSIVALENTKNDMEPAVEESTKELKRMSLDDARPPPASLGTLEKEEREEKEKEEQKELVPAS
jgi:charged multivesicular body protein 7